MDFKDYIQGKRRGKEANQLEQEAVNDPFLHDAIDGYDLVQGDHLRVIEDLEKQIKQKHIKKTPNYRIWAFGIAASFIFLLGITTLLKMFYFTENDFVKQRPQTYTKTENKIKVNEDHAHKPSQIVVDKKNIALNKSKQNTKNTEIKSEQINEVPVAINNNVTGSVTEMEVNDDVKMEVSAIQMEDNKYVPENQPVKIKGLVLDESGQPVTGANVMLKNSNSATVTDINGMFELISNDSANKELVASYIGYQKMEIHLSDANPVLHLKPDNLALNETVVVGYGAKNKTKSHGQKVELDATRTDKTAGNETYRKSTLSAFGEYEFKKYFEQNRIQAICANQVASLTAEFFVDKNGKPLDIKIKTCNCKELEKEFLRLINICPNWTDVNRTVYLTIRLK